MFAVILPIVKMEDRGPLFYRGTRLGYRKQAFILYKIRTLSIDAEEQLTGRLVGAGNDLETRIGGLLRDTRIDELPQLINVIRGEMVFIGPRPERPSVYETQCRDIPHYDQRFAAYPGLIGPSQLMTPHSTDKRIRARIDNRSVHSRKRDTPTDVMKVMVVMAYLAVRATSRVGIELWDRIVYRFRYGNSVNRRRMRRVYASNVVVTALDKNDQPLSDGPAMRIADMEHGHLRVHTLGSLPSGAARLRLKITKRMPLTLFRMKTRTAYCTVAINAVRPTRYQGFDRDYVFEYRAETPLQRYLIDKYFLDASIL